jgi:hypothetical protein
MPPRGRRSMFSNAARPLRRAQRRSDSSKCASRHRTRMRKVQRFADGSIKASICGNVRARHRRGSTSPPTSALRRAQEFNLRARDQSGPSRGRYSRAALDRPLSRAISVSRSLSGADSAVNWTKQLGADYTVQWIARSWSARTVGRPYCHDVASAVYHDVECRINRVD